MPNPYNNKVVLSNGTTLIDLSTDTVTDPSHIMSGYVGHLADGSVVTGTGSGGGEAAVWQGSDDYIYLSDTVPAPVEIYMDGDDYVVLDMQPPALNLQTKTVTPQGTAQNVRADVGYDALEEVDVAAVPVGEYDIGVSGSRFYTENSQRKWAIGTVADVWDGWLPSGSYTGIEGKFLAVPSGTTITPTTTAQTVGGVKYMMEDAITVAAVPTGTAGTPTATKSAVFNHSLTVTPSVTNVTGYITGGTKTGTAVSVAASELVSGTIYIDDGGTWNVAEAASAVVASGTEGTPTATKGAVSNHAITVTPSVTNTEGYIAGGTRTGTAVSVAASELVSGTLNVTSNGTSDVTNYASVNVNVSGGTSSWTLLGQTTVTTSTTSTSSVSLTTVSCGSALWTASKIIYVRVRDTAGRRNGYFYGTDTFYENHYAAIGSSSGLTEAMRIVHRQATNGSPAMNTQGGSTGYGVFGYQISNTGTVSIYQRYSATYSLTIDGTYKIEVYSLDYPDGVGPF